jgi:hypothetical protein
MRREIESIALTFALFAIESYHSQKISKTKTCLNSTFTLEFWGKFQKRLVVRACEWHPNLTGRAQQKSVYSRGSFPVLNPAENTQLSSEKLCRCEIIGNENGAFKQALFLTLTRIIV